MSKELFMRDWQQFLQADEPELYAQPNLPTMKLALTRPIAFIDIESTGSKPDKDRIVEISICKLLPDFARETKTWRINPGIAIPSEAVDIHGITWEQVKDCPKFDAYSLGIYAFLDNCDVAGFNSNVFDIPMLFNEFNRCGIYWDYSQFSMVDVGNIYKIKEPRTLSAAYKFYCGKELVGAHGAEADILATVDVFIEQMNHYTDLPDNVPDLALLSNYDKPVLDLSGKFYLREDGQIAFNFGKNKGERALDHLDFVSWMYYKADFQPDTRRICASLLGKRG